MHNSKHVVQVGSCYPRLSLGENYEPCTKKWCAVSNSFFLSSRAPNFGCTKKWCMVRAPKSGAYKCSKVLELSKKIKSL